MSWSIWFEVEVDGHPVTVGGDYPDLNYTHNCNPMIRMAGLEEWPNDVAGWSAKKLGDRLHAVLLEMESNPETYKAMNPANGWGDYTTLLDVLWDVYRVCAKFPSSTVGMSA